MKILCEKCGSNSADYILEITLIRICKRCYLKILYSRINAQLKKINNKKIEIHPLSHSFFNITDIEIIFNKITKIRKTNENKHKKENIENKNEENKKILIATKEVASIILISFLSRNPDNKNSKDNIDELITVIKEMKRETTIIPLIQLSMNELNILINEDKKIELDIHHKYKAIYEMLNNIELTHKDASSGLSKSLMDIIGIYAE